MSGPCVVCGDAVETFTQWFKGSTQILCFGVSDCMRRAREREEADAWYDTMVERMKERAPA